MSFGCWCYHISSQVAEVVYYLDRLTMNIFIYKNVKILTYSFTRMLNNYHIILLARSDIFLITLNHLHVHISGVDMNMLSNRDFIDR